MQGFTESENHFFYSKGKPFEYPSDVEYCKVGGYENEDEREEYEKFVNSINLISLNPYESKEVYCKIDFENSDLIAGAYLDYTNEKFKSKKQNIILEINSDKNKEQNDG